MRSVLTSWFWPLVCGVLVTVFTGLVFRQYLQRRKIHQLAWSIGFAMWAVATFMELAAILLGFWPDMVYRFYIVVTVGLVPVLGYGSIRLIARKAWWGWAYLVVNVGVMAVFAWGVFTSPLDTAELAKATAASYAGLGAKGTYPRILSAFVSVPGTLVLLWGAVHSIVLFLRKKAFAYRMWANVLIAAATLVIAGGGALAAAGNSVAFYVVELVSASLFLWGFLLASTLDRGGRAAVLAAREQRGDDTPRTR